MGPFKRFVRSDATRRTVSWLAAQYMRVVKLTGRWEVIRGDVPAAYWDSGKPFILAFWHGQIMMMPFCWRQGLPIRMLISSHRDGLLISRTVARFGIDTVAGSSTRGGGAAFRSLIRALKEGVCVGITPDGPRGPRNHAFDGVVHLGRLSGIEVIPCGISMTRRRMLASWDRFVLAWPFSRGVCVWGAPIAIPPGGSAEEHEALRLQIELAINAVTAEAESHAGHPPSAPGPWLDPGPEAES